MKPDQNGQIDHIKRQAKKLKKQMGIPHHEALDVAARSTGYGNWKNALNSTSIPNIKPAAKLPLPNPVTLKYRMAFSSQTYSRPNARMNIDVHREVGSILMDAYAAAYPYRKSVWKYIQSVQSTLDEWVQREYSATELPFDEFADLYYHGPDGMWQKYIAAEQKDHLIKRLQQARIILGNNYHDCPPLESPV